MRSPRKLLSALALAAFALFLATSVPVALATSASRLLSALRVARQAGDDPYEARLRSFGLPYVETLETIRRTIPPNGVYALVDGEDDVEGSPLWVRHDLAPRKAIYLGKMRELPSVQRLQRRLPGRARWVIVAHAGNRAPVLVERYRFLRELEARRGR
jgi:hypothetical protein